MEGERGGFSKTPCLNKSKGRQQPRKTSTSTSGPMLTSTQVYTHKHVVPHTHKKTYVDVYIPHTSMCAKIKKGKKSTEHKMAVFIRIQPPFQSTVEPDAMIMKVYLNGRCEPTLGVMV